MHAVGLHSALAIRRERKRRAEQQRARDTQRRYSLQSSESGVTSPHCSSAELERARRPPRHPPPHQDNDIVSSVGMLHLGVVFLVLGLFLVGSGWLPDDVTAWSHVGSVSWFNELVCSGLFALCVGAFLVVLHKYLTKSEEDALEEYVQRQLTRSRSGHRLERDAETGGMSTRHARRARATEVGLPAHPPPPHPLEDELYPAPGGHGFLNALEAHALHHIAEEECGAGAGAGAGFNRATYCARAPSLTLSTPPSPRELLDPRPAAAPRPAHLPHLH